MILVDSSVWIDHFNDTRSAAADQLDQLLGGAPILVGDLILVEVLQGFRTNHEFLLARNKLLKLPLAHMVGDEIAVAAAENHRFLRAKGVTVRKTIDMLIGTFCIERGHALLHSDRDFDAMEQHLGL